MISSKPEHFKEGPRQVRDSRPGPLLSWQNNFCRDLRGRTRSQLLKKRLPLYGTEQKASLSGQLERDTVPGPSQHL